MRAGTAGAGSEAVSLPRNAETIAVVLLVLGSCVPRTPGMSEIAESVEPYITCLFLYMHTFGKV
jgi:hypothetical protein